MDSPGKSPLKLAFVIIAQDEEHLIRSTVENICNAMKKDDILFVVSDHSSDRTAYTAKDAGAEVLVRNSGKNGKGAALAWFMLETRFRLTDFDCIVILDADSTIGKDFREQLERGWSEKTLAAQCYLQPVGFETSQLGRLIALAELIDQEVFDALRAQLGFSVRLRGTGMVFSPGFLLKLSPRIGTEVEDLVLCLLTANEKTTVRWIRSAVVFDPKPTEHKAASRQRGRWYRGQWHALWAYRKDVFKIIGMGPAGWAVLSSIFLKPRWFKLFCFCLLGLAFLRVPAVAIIFFVLTVVDIIQIIVGITRLSKHGYYLRALFHVPGFIWMWVKAFMLSLKRQPWARVRQMGKLHDNLDDDNRITSPGEAQLH